MTMDEREGHIYRWGNLLRMQGTEGRGYFITDLETSETYGITMLGCVEDKHPYFRTFPFLVSKADRKIERVSAEQKPWTVMFVRSRMLPSLPRIF